MGFSPRSHKERDVTERLNTAQYLHIVRAEDTPPICPAKQDGIFPNLCCLQQFFFQGVGLGLLAA